MKATGARPDGTSPVPEPQAFLSSILSSSDDAILTKDLQGTITSWNAAAGRILGYSAAEAIGRPARMLIPPGLEPEETSILERIARGEHIQRLQTRRRRKDGTLVEVSVTVSPLVRQDGRIVGACTVARDVGQQRREALLFRGVTESTADGIVAANQLGLITYVNPAAEKMFGFTESEVLGRSLVLLMPERFRDAHVAGLARFLSTGVARVIGKTVELAGQRKDGTEFPLELTISAHAAGGEQIFGAIIRDLTERRRAEEERAVAKEREHEITRLGEVDQFKTQFINAAAHELLTPLTPMRSVLHVLKARQASDPNMRTNIELLSRNLDRLNRIVTDLLDVSRLEAGKLSLRMKKVRLRQVIQDATLLFESELQRKELRVEQVVPEAMEVQADPDRLGQIMTNLVSNAIKFSPGRGKIRIEARPVDGQTVVFVADSGRGIPPEAIPQLFRPFSRLESPSDVPQPGSGLGLFIVKGLVELHGGRVWVESEGLGKGATFAFSLPS